MIFLRRMAALAVVAAVAQAWIPVQAFAAPPATAGAEAALRTDPGDSAIGRPAEGASALAPGACKTGNQALFYSPHPLLDSRTAAGFSDSLAAQLRDPLRDLGYCLEPVRDYRTLLDTARFGDNLMLQPLVQDDPEGRATLLVALLRIRELARGKLAEAVSRPLVALRFDAAEVSSLPSIMAKKVSENLRSQYVADLLIRSHPPGAGVRTPSGLEGRTPVEWVMPLGIVPVTLEKPGYLPLQRDIDLGAPGLHAYDLQMVRRRFYHSRFMIPALAAGVLAGAAFVIEDHYYSAYRSLGAADQKNNPQAFADRFHDAKDYERLGYAALGLAGFSLGLSFVF